MRRLPDGRYEYTTKHGVSLVMTAEALVKRLVALVPPARLHLTSGHGVYAANAALRSVVLRQEPVPAQQPQEAPAAATQQPPSPSPTEQEKPKRRPKLDWATLQARTASAAAHLRERLTSSRPFRTRCRARRHRRTPSAGVVDRLAAK